MPVFSSQRSANAKGGPYLMIPHYAEDFAPTPKLNWEQVDKHTFICHAGKSTLTVLRFGEGKPWWAECDTPDFESKTWFWTAEQAQFWAEEALPKGGGG